MKSLWSVLVPNYYFFILNRYFVFCCASNWQLRAACRPKNLKPCTHFREHQISENRTQPALP